MWEIYNSFGYWENVINKNKTIRGHMFMNKPPEENSMYFHTLIFGKSNGINNIWGYVPNTRALLGYLQYSFLQEGFYRWIYGKDKLITRIPNIKVDKIISDGEKNKKITKEVAENMREDYDFLYGLWNLSDKKINIELKKFFVDFNRKWLGDNSEYLYLKIFNTPEELGEFVITSSSLTNTQEELEKKLGMTIDEWRDICKNTIFDKGKGEIFKESLLKKLSEVL